MFRIDFAQEGGFKDSEGLKKITPSYLDVWEEF